ncbi:septum formation family protein [Amycolatopsis sp. FDAARGOS 1241]|uniref:septum formation family protein n=1 Tax=Amycolatopsis sp. FDAARGOS 1241 TaxID=2778070 RepID=UPI0019516878|nr:septum formation family protein [Amycolatopsis sp. FDAARGOS 1241]QRP45876.1 septum formation family protein [Amycolatopsis sp. FDAARGOS 1241]
MSPDAERFRPPLNPLSTRVVMAGVFLGAVIALALSVTFSWTSTLPGGAGGGEGKLTAAAEEAFHSPPGSCLTWTAPDASDVKKVACTQPHLFEVTGLVDIGAQYNAQAPFPNLDQWQQIAQTKCNGDVAPYLGHPLDPYGKLTTNLLRPTAAQWADGNRQLRCGLQWAGPGGGLQPTTGPAKSQDQSAVWDPGTCLALAGKGVGDPVPCSRPHSYEIIATIDLATHFKDGYPKQDDQDSWLDTECNKAADDYTGKADLNAKKLTLGWDLREQESWDVGSTKVNCKVAATLSDGSGFQAVTGSVKDNAGQPDPSGAPSDQGGGKSSTPPSSSGNP